MTNGNSEILTPDEIFYIMRVSIVRGRECREKHRGKML